MTWEALASLPRTAHARRLPGAYQSVIRREAGRACQAGKQRVFSAWRKCRSSLGHVDGGGGTSEAPGPHGTSLPSPPDRLGASGLCQRLWPLQTPIYMTAEESGLDQGEGGEKYEPDSSAPVQNAKPLPVCTLCMCENVLAGGGIQARSS